jgi:hypothetical protein
VRGADPRQGRRRRADPGGRAGHRHGQGRPRAARRPPRGVRPAHRRRVDDRGRHLRRRLRLREEDRRGPHRRHRRRDDRGRGHGEALLPRGRSHPLPAGERQHVADHRPQGRVQVGRHHRHRRRRLPKAVYRPRSLRRDRRAARGQDDLRGLGRLRRPRRGRAGVRRDDVPRPRDRRQLWSAAGRARGRDGPDRRAATRADPAPLPVPKPPPPPIEAEKLEEDAVEVALVTAAAAAGPPPPAPPPPPPPPAAAPPPKPPVQPPPSNLRMVEVPDDRTRSRTRPTTPPTCPTRTATSPRRPRPRTPTSTSSRRRAGRQRRVRPTPPAPRSAAPRT